jgi:hypothetical protein
MSLVRVETNVKGESMQDLVYLQGWGKSELA